MTPYRRSRSILLALALLLAPAASAAAQADTAAVLHLLRRATWGVRAGDLSEALRIGPDAWLERQLRPDRIPDDKLVPRLAGLEELGAPMADLARRYPPVGVLAREIAERHDLEPADLTDPERRRTLSPAIVREFRERGPRRLESSLQIARLVRAVHSERQLEDVMTDFWYNHFNVWAGKQLTRFMVADYERTAIRPHVFGRFEDMLIATARHPAMLFYLDNWTSVAPDSQRAGESGRAMRRMRGRGLNENYARELLELHTLGVDGGYTQDDVVDVARVLTGWSFVPFRLQQRAPRRPLVVGEPGTFAFNAAGHDAGTKHVLGATFDANGTAEGEALLRMLARRPETARFVSTKLVERFVSDRPDAALVDELTTVWLRTDGDLREVTRALFTSPHFQSADVRGAKVKTPFELVASALRVTGAEVLPSRRTLETLRSMGHLPYGAQAPTGYPANAEEWVNSGAMLARMNFALELAAGRLDGVRPDAGIAGATVSIDGMLATVLPGTAAAALRAVIAEDLEANADDAAPRARGSRALGLALGSPEFQTR